MLKLFRLHQWSKNLLVYVPLILAHRVTDFRAFLSVTVSFFAFGLAASGIYIINDIVDLEADRVHTRKRLRSLAAGLFPLAPAALISITLVLAGLAAGLALNFRFGTILLTYLGLVLVYMMVVKRVVLADVLLLACLYALRLFAGALVAGVPASAWLIAFSVFIFFSLAMAKRVSELILTDSEGGEFNNSRGYRIEDLNSLRQFGVCSGYVAVLVLALYINSDRVRTLYPSAEYLWFNIPIFLYWISRFWLLTDRGKMRSDPVVFALRDPMVYVLAVVVLMTLWIGSR